MSLFHLLRKKLLQKCINLLKPNGYFFGEDFACYKPFSENEKLELSGKYQTRYKTIKVKKIKFSNFLSFGESKTFLLGHLILKCLSITFTPSSYLGL